MPTRTSSAAFVGRILLKDPDSRKPAALAVYRESGGRLFALDGLFLAAGRHPVYSPFTRDLRVLLPEELGAVSEGTRDPRLVLPRLLGKLADLDEAAARRLCQSHVIVLAAIDAGLDVSRWEAAADALGALCRLLDSLAPEGFRFGSFSDDRLCLGFFPAEDCAGVDARSYFQES